MSDSKKDPRDNVFNRKANKVLSKNPIFWFIVVFGIFIAAALLKALG